jgi:Zn-dependent metalloprotease
MNRIFKREARIIVISLVVLALAVVVASYSTSQAAETPVAQSMSAQFYAPIVFQQAGSSSIDLRQDDPPGVDPNLLQSLRQNAQGQASISTNASTGYAGFVRVDQGGDLLPAVAGDQRRAQVDQVTQFLTDYGGVFGVRDVSAELVQVGAFADQYGGSHAIYQQVYNGVPVFAGELRAHQNAQGQLTAVNGTFVPDINVNTIPALSAEDAASRAIADVLANLPKDDNLTGASLSISAADLSVQANTLYVYRDGLLQDVAGPNLLAYEVVVTDGAGVREFVYINAHSGKIVNRYSATHDALFRRLFEMNTTNQVWQEGDPFPGSLNQDQQNIVNFSGNSYYFFLNAFGRDSYDGAGAEMRSVNNDPRIACPNANWNGITTNYCNGVTSDDVVAHEWGHAYTQYTHNLIYQWQPGALNESYSDIWGEVIDQINGVGTDSPGPVRTAEVCSIHTTPVPKLVINSPATIAGDYLAGSASFGPQLTAAGVTGNVVLGDDGVAPGSDACTPLVNGAAVSGNIALVDRGTCAFTIKVKNAQDAGAIAVIVADNVPGPVAGMSGADPTIVIPSVRVTLDTGNLIKSELATGVNATLTIVGGATPEDSYRWLVAEDSTAFGGAIRDMWSPTCMADPGKVSDPEYHCATSDAGGVHTNSGVPNHGFALLVDGGTYNGQTINAIGVTKAAHIYWQAQTAYQTPSSDFADHADALEASCTDLIGQPLKELGTDPTPTGTSSEVISSADCGEISKMIDAVELRLDPTAQCNFQPLLNPNAPRLCSEGKPNFVFRENFRNGLRRWKTSNQGVFSGWPNLNWVSDNTPPGDKDGWVAFAPEPDAGNCDAGAGDISGAMFMESPLIRIPDGRPFMNPRLAFDHYVATEAGWDGGNLKISINEGPYMLVPASAYTFNPYNTTLQTTAAGNTNPLAGQPAFSGTDGGQVDGSWGQSQIDLTALGVKAGDRIRLRYDFGMDGCTGVDGWYVDNVEVYSCRP